MVSAKTNTFFISIPQAFRLKYERIVAAATSSPEQLKEILKRCAGDDFGADWLLKSTLEYI